MLLETNLRELREDKHYHYSLCWDGIFYLDISILVVKLDRHLGSLEKSLFMFCYMVSYLEGKL